MGTGALAAGRSLYRAPGRFYEPHAARYVTTGFRDGGWRGNRKQSVSLRLTKHYEDELQIPVIRLGKYLTLSAYRTDIDWVYSVSVT